MHVTKDFVFIKKLTKRLLCNNMNITLTIGIPVYRRPDLLRKLIDSILCSVSGDDVEILVCDDSSDRVNEKVVSYYSDQGRFRYIHNEVNLGIDANIKKCFDEASGEYVLVIGEDDIVSEGSIDNIVNELKSDNAFDAVVLNYIYCTNDHKKNIGSPLFDSSMIINRNSLLENFYKFGFIGSFVISKACWDRYTPESPLGTYFHHLGVLGKVCFEGDFISNSIGFVSDVCVRNRAEDASSNSWIESSFNVHFGFYKALDHFASNLTSSELVKLHSHSRALFRPKNFLWVLAKRADGVYGLSQFREYYSAEPIFSKLIYLSIAIYPPFLAQFMKKIYYKIRDNSI